MSVGSGAATGPPGGGAGCSSIRKVGAGSADAQRLGHGGDVAASTRGSGRARSAGVTKLRVSPLRRTPTTGAEMAAAAGVSVSAAGR